VLSSAHSPHTHCLVIVLGIATVAVITVTITITVTSPQPQPQTPATTAAAASQRCIRHRRYSHCVMPTGDNAWHMLSLDIDAAAGSIVVVRGFVDGSTSGSQRIVTSPSQRLQGGGCVVVGHKSRNPCGRDDVSITSAPLFAFQGNIAQVRYGVGCVRARACVYAQHAFSLYCLRGVWCMLYGMVCDV
jgi:hypothetical protein